MSVQLLKAQFLLPLLPVKNNMLVLSFSWRGNGEELYTMNTCNHVSGSSKPVKSLLLVDSRYLIKLGLLMRNDCTAKVGIDPPTEKSKQQHHKFLSDNQSQISVDILNL
jgi:hypothetical protein